MQKVFMRTTMKLNNNMYSCPFYTVNVVSLRDIEEWVGYGYILCIM